MDLTVLLIGQKIIKRFMGEFL